MIKNKVKNNWKTTILGDLVSLKTGKLNSNAADPHGEYPFFTCSQENFKTSTYSFDTEAVLLGGNNANGIYPLKFFKGKFDAYQRTYIIRSVNEKSLNNRFLFYSLRPKLDILKSISTGAATKFLTLGLLKNLEITLPPITIQHKIASILSAYDDLIENNLRRIKILEEMAQLIYREWFVHFRFPGHEKVRFVDSELGKIPEGWDIVMLKEIVENINKSTIAGDHLSERKYIPIDCIPRKSLFLEETKNWEEAQSSLILFEENDILFGAMRPYFHKVIISPIKGVTRKTCFVLRPIKEVHLAYSLMLIFQSETVDYANAHSRGSTIPYAVWAGSLANKKILLPDEKIIEKYQDIVFPMIKKLQSFFPINNNLRQTRDLLLPRLISGEIDVSDLDIEIRGDL